MKKKGILMVVLLFFLTVAVVYLGYSYSDKQQEELIHATSTAAEKEETADNEEGTIETVDPATYEEKREQLSVLDYLKYIGTQNEEIAIAFYGQLPETESWTGNTVNTLETELNLEVKSTLLTASETDSYELYITNKAQELAETNAAVVFFMIPALGDQVRDVSLEDSKDYLTRNVTQIQEVLPDTLVVLVSPHPTNSAGNSLNSRMLDYVQYTNSGIEAAEENNMPVFDLHAAYTERLTAENIELTTVLQEDGTLLNSQGEELMSELFMEQLIVPVDTTSGIQ
ncbi:SGNH/GDSL hydrolase family protein [Desemzia sp. FAM 23991]|uniref:SGNH/GDSL hydrolase family protein n=1 Tax=unclassified Desemzia TaxID=2685243 RepID=UPI0038895BE8